MARWMKPTEEFPEVEAGDRVLIIVAERKTASAKKRPIVVILEATEDGWFCGDETYAGYTPHDGVLWTTENGLCEIAAVVCPEEFDQ